jgi:putative ABC transport system substrate-binding protein
MNQRPRAGLHRRTAMALPLLAALVWSTALTAQPVTRRPRIGVLMPGQSPADAGNARYIVEPFRQGLREQGYVEGQTILIDYRWAEARLERLPALLAELIALGPDVLVTLGPNVAKLAKQANLAIPIVATLVDSPVQDGLAVSLTRPGGNVTGVASSVGSEMIAKRLQLLKEIAPGARRLAILTNPDTVPRAGIERVLPGFEQSLGATVVLHDARGPDAFDGVFAALARDRVEGIVIVSEPMIYAHRARLQELCVKHRLPSAWGGRGYLEPGGLVSFQSDFPTIFRRAAVLVGQILSGAKPGEIPFELPTKFELIVNLKAAKALAISVPQSVLLRADEVIE